MRPRPRLSDSYRFPGFRPLQTVVGIFPAWVPEHLVGAHGPAIPGRDEIRRRVTKSRDVIQFLWDHTVRGINKGWATDELA